ncbi:MAG TPA: 7-cyano-7-deazaguanine synthase [Tepidisphaeraceae bacterium]|nr:7-cyano-7-deazaguanine synthase [Tepidisphaeraceae bacterium]
MAKDFAIVLNNGSLNSAVATALAAQKYRPILVFAETTANVGSRQRAAYEQQVSHFKPYREHGLAMPFLSSLRSQSSEAAQTIDPRHRLLLPPRLMELLPLVSMGIRLAAHYEAAAIYLGLRVGADADELAQATEYLQILNELVQIPCDCADLEIAAPLLELEPWQVVDVGFQVNAPFERAWSCLEEASDPCGTCAGCRNREQAFQQAGKPDPQRVLRKL